MAAFSFDSEDGAEEEFSSPLPPEDRLWRHPSEVGGGELSLRLDPTVVRNRWLSSHPTRASAWTAGLVGALLATGLVVLGTHLATALTTKPVQSGPSTLGGFTNDAAVAASSVQPLLAGLGTTLAASVQRVGASVVDIDTVSVAGDQRILGVIISSDGSVLTSAAALQGASSILVNLPGDEVVPAISTAVDEKSGLAVLRVNGIGELPTADFSAAAVDTSSVALALTAAGGSQLSLGTVTRLDVAPTVGDETLVDALTTDLADSPPGSPVLDARGELVGIVAGPSAAGTVVVPSWLALPVAKQLLVGGEVDHGWIGIKGVTSSRRLPGVLVTVVTSPSAGARAGISAGDVITALDGTPTTSMPALQGRLYAMRPGTTVTLKVVHDGAKLLRRVRLGGEAA